MRPIFRLRRIILQRRLIRLSRIIRPRVHSFGLIWIRISDPRSLGSWCIKGTDESVTRVDSTVPLMHHNPSDLGSLIRFRITPKERTLGRIIRLTRIIAIGRIIRLRRVIRVSRIIRLRRIVRLSGIRLRRRVSQKLRPKIYDIRPKTPSESQKLRPKALSESQKLRPKTSSESRRFGGGWVVDFL